MKKFNRKRRNRLIKIMLDAGHYGSRNQSPAVPEYYESRRMWTLCEMLCEELEIYGFEVFKTRTDPETDLAVTKRGEMAKDCDLFISLHSNAVGGSGGANVDRVDVYAAYDNLNGSHELARLLSNAVAECMQVSEGKVKTRKSEKGDWEYYGVLRGARSVGCPLFFIIEHSFHTNEYAARWLLEDENLKKLARVEASVIAGYYGVVNEFEPGDVNMNGRIDPADYVLVKRAVLKTRKLTPEQEKLADMNKDGKIGSRDYIALKRKYLGK